MGQIFLNYIKPIFVAIDEYMHIPVTIGIYAIRFSDILVMGITLSFVCYLAKIFTGGKGDDD